MNVRCALVAALVGGLLSVGAVARAAVLPRDAEGGFARAMETINTARRLGDGVTLENVAIDKDLARLTFELPNGAAPVSIELRDPGVAGEPVGRWFRVADAPDDPTMRSLLPGLAAVLDESFSETPWLAPVRGGSGRDVDLPGGEHPAAAAPRATDDRASPVVEPRRRGVFWSIVVATALAWLVPTLVRRRRNAEPG